MEEIDHRPEAKPLKEKPQQARAEMRRINIDTAVGMAVSNFRRDQMGRFTISMPVRIFGWASTAVMGFAAVAMLVF